MTFEAAPFSSDAAACFKKTVASLRSAPVQLREGVHTFLSLAKLHPDLHPAVLASILARPACERRSLLEAARASAESKLCSGSEHKQGGKQQQGAAGSAETLSSDSDEVWEDAVEELVDSAAKKQRAFQFQGDGVDMATVVVDGAQLLQHLELEAADWRRAWQETRQLGAWTRYNECRKRLAELRDKERREAKRAQDDEDRAQQEAKWSQLEALREVHERRLAELNRRRERLRLSRQYHEQTRLHHAQLAQAQLQQQLRELEQRQELRRLQHLKRVQQLVQELAASDALQQPGRRASSASSAPSTPSPAAEDVFTHMWDDFSHWEKMVSDDKENEAVERPATSCSTVSSTVSSTTSLPPFANQPDLIPVMAPPVGVPAVCSAASSTSSSASSSGLWRHKSTSVGGHPQGSPHAARRHSVAADGFQERKKWFEEALLSWHAQDEEEDFGTSLYASSSTPLPPVEAIGGGRGSRAGSDHSDHSHHGSHHGYHHGPTTSPWHHGPWSAWAAPPTSTY